jgi:putative DNA primase/helicase
VKLGLLKDITGDDEVSARRPYDRGLTVFRPACTIFVNCNEPPRIPGGDLGTWSRVWFVPWKARFEESSGNRVEDFGRKLATTEGSGILNWLLKGLELALEEGIDPPDAMIALQQEIRESEDPLHLFAQECLEPAPPNAAPEARRVSNKELWGAWRRWCEENGLEPGNTVRLSKRIRSSDSMIGPFKVEKSQWRSGKIRGYVGVRLARRVGASPRGNPTTG